MFSIQCLDEMLIFISTFYPTWNFLRFGDTSLLYGSPVAYLRALCFEGLGSFFITITRRNIITSRNTYLNTSLTFNLTFFKICIMCMFLYVVLRDRHDFSHSTYPVGRMTIYPWVPATFPVCAFCLGALLLSKVLWFK